MSSDVNCSANIESVMSHALELLAGSWWIVFKVQKSLRLRLFKSGLGEI